MIALTRHLLYNGNKVPLPVAVAVPGSDTAPATLFLGDYQ